MKIKKNTFQNYFNNIIKKLNILSRSTVFIFIFILSIIFILFNCDNKTKENMNNKTKENINNNKCCTMNIDKNYNDEKIGNLGNKAKLSLYKLCCKNPDLVYCDC